MITHELFVNICGWEQMLAPKSENDAIPVMAGEIKEVKDGEATYSVVDVIVHPVVTKGVINSKDRKNLLVHVALDYLENAKQIQVSRKYKNLKKSFKGDPKTLRKYLRQGREQALNPTNSEEQRKGVSQSPESLLRQLSSITVSESQQDGNDPIDLFERFAEKPKKVLIEEVSSTNTVPMPITPSYEVLEKDAEDSKPKRIIVKVNLPNIISSSQCQLDVCEVWITFKYSFWQGVERVLLPPPPPPLPSLLFIFGILGHSFIPLAVIKCRIQNVQQIYLKMFWKMFEL